MPAHHRRGGVAEEVLHVDLPGVVLDGPGGEGVPERWGLAAATPRGPGCRDCGSRRDPAACRADARDSSAPTGGSAEAPRLLRDRTAVSEGDSLGMSRRTKKASPPCRSWACRGSSERGPGFAAGVAATRASSGRRTAEPRHCTGSSTCPTRPAIARRPGRRGANLMSRCAFHYLVAGRRCSSPRLET